MFLVPLGLFAGLLTTVAGLGGGQLLVLAIAAAWGPREALVVTSPALLMGNLHRLWLYRTQLDRPVAVAFMAGALPGSIAGGLIAVGLPPAAIHALLISTTVAAVTRSLGWWSWRPRAAALAPAGLGIGAICATSSGAGLLVSPILLSTGLTGAAYVATSSACAASMHFGRLFGYSVGGLLTWHVLGSAALLGSSILVGNLIGDRLRRRLDAKSSKWIEQGTLVACVALAVVGLRR